MLERAVALFSACLQRSINTCAEHGGVYTNRCSQFFIF
ncbi:hypothetical protein JCM19274_3843 [Algibacter lectus]|uniref:Uncharacterized protein n=1 Tax=Algibacter lectus TaxID=221126 RepID=A0A090WZY6_9FLAO|nr:hypothetical protein JCM19274_3843 [Algibacter lectus]